MSRAVRFVRLELEGFAIWRSRTIFEFPERIGVLALPNEAGKSTMVAGLRHLIFGLPGESDPAVPGIGRYRSWRWDGPCRGSLDLRAGDRAIRIRRDFVSHKTAIEELDPAGEPQKRLFEGVANPAGKTAVREEYRRALREILGDLADPNLKGDLFAASFLVSQPIRIEETAGKTLVRLVSGVGRIGGESAREVLFNRVKALTKETKELGLIAPGRGQAAAQRIDGEIERARARIGEIRSRRDGARDAFEKQLRLDDALARTELALADAAKEEEHARLDRDGLASFRKELDRAGEARAAREELKKALGRFDEEIGRAAEMDRNRDAAFPDLEETPADLPSMIDVAAAAETNLASAEASVDEWKQRIAESEILLESAGNARWAKRADIAADASAWLARVRAGADRFCEALGRRHAFEEEKGKLLSERSLLSAVGTLPEEVQDEILRLDDSLRALEEQQAFAARAVDDRRLLGEELDRKREAHFRRYASLDGIDTERFVALLETRAARHRRIAEVALAITAAREEVAAAPPRRRRLRAILIAAPAAALAAAAVLVARLPAAVAVAAAALVLPVVFLLASRMPRSLREAQSRLASLEKESIDLQGLMRSEFLPPIPGLIDDSNAPQRAREIFSERDAEAEAIRSLEASLSEPPDADDPSAALDRARSRNERLREEARNLEEATGRPATDAVRAYRDAGAAINRIEGELAGSDRQLFGERGIESADPLALSPERLDPDWSAVRDAADLFGISAPTIADLRAAVGAIPQAQWDGWGEEARRFAEARSAESHARAELRTAEERRERLERDLAESVERIGPARLAASNGSLSRLRERLQERDELSRKAASVREAAGHILTAARQGPYADRAALEAAIEAQDEVLRHSQKTAAETREASELLRNYETQDPADKDRLRREVEARADGARDRLDSVRRDFETARAERNTWSPPPGSNIAQLDLEIASLEAVLQIQEMRRDAAARAWHILGEAVDEYRSAHRATLEEAIDSRFRAITGRESRRVNLAPDLGIEITDAGAPAIESQLSQGAQDQLAFCLRLAVADLIAGEIRLPVVLDDPFVHSDAERLERIRAALEAAAAERQVIFLTQDARLSSWGDPIRIAPA